MRRAVAGRRVLLRGGVLAVAAGTALWGFDRSAHTYAYSGTPMAPQPAPPLALADDAGGNFDLSQQRGDVVLVYFGYTHCPDVCPTTLTMMVAALTQLGTDARRVQSVFVTLDPGRDTASALREYLASFTTNSAPTPIGLTGSAEAIAAAARDWGVTWRPSARSGLALARPGHASGGARLKRLGLLSAASHDWGAIADSGKTMNSEVRA
jgi:cytochrome oxidase Cu insertion factor (SCO1/SenC/PrrC family)